jgi:hypothetical protein
MKFTPDIEFEEDVGLTQVERVTQLLKEIGVTSPPPSATPAESAGSTEGEEEG